MGEQLLFLGLGSTLIATAIAVVRAQNPVTSAMALVVNLFLVACLYASMDAHFVATIQILVYTGAIMVLFLFVIMLLNQRPEDEIGPSLSLGEIVGTITVVGGFALLGLLALGIKISPQGSLIGLNRDQSLGHLEKLGLTLFSKYLWPFEVASFLILLAIVATVVVAKRDKPLKVKKGEP